MTDASFRGVKSITERINSIHLSPKKKLKAR